MWSNAELRTNVHSTIWRNRKFKMAVIHRKYTFISARTHDSGNIQKAIHIIFMSSKGMKLKRKMYHLSERKIFKMVVTKPEKLVFQNFQLVDMTDE